MKKNICACGTFIHSCSDEYGHDETCPYFMKQIPVEIEIINLTPHEIVIEDMYGRLVTFEPSGNVLRLEERSIPTASLAGISSSVKVFSVGNLPPVQPGVFYIVSLPVAQLANRSDFLVPGGFVRDEKGVIVRATELYSVASNSEA